VVVAICRLESKEWVQAELGQLFNELEVLQLPTFTIDDYDPEATKIIADFQRHGSTRREDWDGTLGSLVLGLSTKNQEYLKIQNESAAVVLRAMKLLTTANILRHTERLLLAVGTEIFGEKTLLDQQRWQEAKSLLLQEQFVLEEVANASQELILVIRKDTYFEKVITDYPALNRPHQLLHDLMRLQSVLVTLKDTSGLFNLGNALGRLKRYEESLQALERAIELDPKNAKAFMGKATALSRLERYEETLQAFERAVELGPKDE
jgi:tetratricopeptide (TPR) repeat protein